MRVLFLSLILVTFGMATAADKRPNIIIMLSDDMGYTDIGCYGGEINTPTLDGLAADGLRFTQFYNTGRCCPTRATLLTGLYPHQAGIGHMMEDRREDGYRGDLNKQCVTIAEALKPAGYATFMVGKWHVTKKVRPVKKTDKHNWPLQRGFDRFYGTIHGAGSFWDPNSLTRDNTLISPFADPEYKPKTFYYTDAIVDHASKFIREHETDKPFFMYVAFTAAHWPLHAFPEDIAKYRGKYDVGYGPIREARYKKALELGVIGRNARMSGQVGNWEQVPDKRWEAANMEVYAAMVDRMDQGIARITATLKEKKIFDNTLILFMQDNGGCQEAYGRNPRGTLVERKEKSAPMKPEELQYDMCPRKSRDGWPTRRGHVMPGPADTAIGYGINWANVSNTPFREYKHFTHEGGISTPLIAHWPAGIKAKNALRHATTHLIDLMPTCLELAKAEYPREKDGLKIHPMEGKSLLPVFGGGTIEREYLFWEHEGHRAIRVGDWKLVAKGRHGQDKVRWELYNLAEDRSELKDLSKAEPERFQSMIALWQKHAVRTKVIPWPHYRRRR